MQKGRIFQHLNILGRCWQEKKLCFGQRKLRLLSTLRQYSGNTRLRKNWRKYRTVLGLSTNERLFMGIFICATIFLRHGKIFLNNSETKLDLPYQFSYSIPWHVMAIVYIDRVRLKHDLLKTFQVIIPFIFIWCVLHYHLTVVTSK